MKTMTISSNVIINNMDAEFKRLFSDDNFLPSNVHIKVREIAEDVLWNILFTSAEDDLRYSYVTDLGKETITVELKLEIDFFTKHFGRLVPDLFLKEIIKLRVNIKKAMAKIDWVKLIQKGKKEEKNVIYNKS